MTRGNAGQTVRASKSFLFEWSGSVTLRYDDARCRRRCRHRAALAFSASFCGSVKMSTEREAPKRRQDLCRRRRKRKRLLRRSVGSFASEHATHSLGPFKAEFRRHVAFLPSLSSVERSAVGGSAGLPDFERPLRRREGGRASPLFSQRWQCCCGQKEPRSAPLPRRRAR